MFFYADNMRSAAHRCGRNVCTAGGRGRPPLRMRIQKPSPLGTSDGNNARPQVPPAQSCPPCVREGGSRSETGGLSCDRALALRGAGDVAPYGCVDAAGGGDPCGNRTSPQISPSVCLTADTSLVRGRSSGYRASLSGDVLQRTRGTEKAGRCGPACFLG